MIKYLIIDDEYIAHDIIKGYCDLLPDMQLVKSCYDAIEAFEFLNKQDVDLLFLDLNMPVLKGFEFLKTLRNSPKVIVTTAHKEFAFESYEYNVADYLLKPFSFERFLTAIHKALHVSAVPHTILPESRKMANRMFIQSNKQYIQLQTDELRYIEATGNYTKVVTSTETIVIREKFSTLLELLAQAGPIQVHKSFAVFPEQIKRIEGNRIFIHEQVIPIGKMYKNNLDQLLK